MAAARDSAKRILVTGGAGFLGSHLVDRLLAEGHKVICVDNLYTGTKRNIEHLAGHPRFQFLEHDVCVPLRLDIDEIYNLACPASPIHYQRDPVATTKTSVMGALNMLELATRRNVVIFQASTSEVYGSASVHPQDELYWGNVNPIGPRSCYDEGKRCAETLFFDYHRQHKTRIKVGRIFNTYGPRVLPDDGRVVSSFIVQALTNQDIGVYGDGTQTRSFCYVDDLIEGVRRLAKTGPEVTGPINIGNPHEVSVRDLAETILALTGSRSRITYLPVPTDDPVRRRPDIAEAERVLNWRPTVELKEGLTRTIDYFKRTLLVPSRALAALSKDTGLPIFVT